MRTLLVFLASLALAMPAFAQTSEKKAEKKKPAATKKADKKKAPVKKTEKTTAEPKQDWGRFNSQAKKDEAERTKAAAAKKQ